MFRRQPVSMPMDPGTRPSRRWPSSPERWATALDYRDRVTAAFAAAPAADHPRGIVMPIGGAEDKVGRMTVLREVVRIAGGADARIVVISTASSLGDEITHAYLQIFSSLGVADVVGIRPESRAQASSPDWWPRWTAARRCS